MKAVILAAGRGIRMGDFTQDGPKPMIKLHGKPILEYIIDGLKLAGISEIALMVGYKKEVIKQYFKNGEKFGVNIFYINQAEQKGTGHAALIAKEFSKNEKFFLLYSDVLVSYSIYREIVSLYESEQYALVANPINDPYKGGAIYHDGIYVTDIIEKPPKGTSTSKLNNSGIYLFSPEIFLILNDTPESVRGEIELTEAVKVGIVNNALKFRLVVVNENQIRKDLGDINDYRELSEDNTWLQKLQD